MPESKINYKSRGRLTSCHDKSLFTDGGIVNPPTIARQRFVQGIAFDSSGNLWVTDETNNRVLEYLAISVSVPEFPFGIPVVIVTMSAFYFMMRKKFSLKI